MSGHLHLRVVHVSSAHPWTDNRVHYRECQTLASAGYEVTLVATESAVDGPVGDMSVVVIPRRRRLKRVTLSTLQALRLALRTRAKIFHLHDPELIWAIPLLRLMGKSVIYDAHEDLPDQIKSKSYLSASAKPFAKVAAHSGVAIASLSTHIVAATETIANRFPGHKTSIVRNFPPLRSEEAHAPQIEDRGLAAVYIGALGESRGAAVMVKAAQHFPTGWTLHLAGSLPDALHQNLQKEPGWVSTVYHGELSPAEARDLLLACRVGLVVLEATPAYLESLPTKMFEYFAASLPVVASDFPTWRSVIRDSECCIFVDETSPLAVASAVRRLAEDPKLMRSLSETARRLAENELNWTSEARLLLDAYGRLR